MNMMRSLMMRKTISPSENDKEEIKIGPGARRSMNRRDRHIEKSKLRNYVIKYNKGEKPESEDD